MGTNNKPRAKGASLKLIGLLIFVFSVVISVTLVVSIWLISYENAVVSRANENYLTLKQASTDVQLASDDLTDNVRLFVANADEKYMVAYFKEANETKRREKSLEIIHEFAEQTERHAEIHKSITAAVEESKDLMKLEFFAMKLICADSGISYAKYSEVAKADIGDVAPENRKSVALDSVLGSTYISKKETISYHVNYAIDIIDSLMHENGQTAASNLQKLITFQTVIIIVIVVFVALLILSLYFYVMRPINKAIKAMKYELPIEARGPKEFNYLFDTYNEVRSLNEKVKEKLIYEAEHDKLTSLYNRTGYVSLYRKMKLSETIFVLFDIDNFKQINDAYGHEMGDKVLVRLAETLKKYFSDDNCYAFRLGGDEFAVLLEYADENMDSEIVNRCKTLNKELSKPKGRIPALTLSIGVVHGKEDDTTDSLFKKADIALYKVKQSGKSAVELYQD